jgi:cytochrome c oxidase subunit 2
MVNRSSALVAPRGRWWAPLGRDERMWFAVTVVWAVTMFLMMMFVWPAVGDQQTTFDTFRMDEATFAARTQAFTQQYATTDASGQQVVAPPPGDVYLMSQRFQFRPILQLQRGETYRLLLSSFDVQHGFSLQPDGFNLQVLPGFVSAVELTPKEAGQYTIVCNEFCGLGHHLMTGRIIVVD